MESEDRFCMEQLTLPGLPLHLLDVRYFLGLVKVGHQLLEEDVPAKLDMSTFDTDFGTPLGEQERGQAW